MKVYVCVYFCNFAFKYMYLKSIKRMPSPLVRKVQSSSKIDDGSNVSQLQKQLQVKFQIIDE